MTFQRWGLIMRMEAVEDVVSRLNSRFCNFDPRQDLTEPDFHY